MTKQENKTVLYVCPSANFLFQQHGRLVAEAAKRFRVHAVLGDAPEAASGKGENDGPDAGDALARLGATVHRSPLRRGGANPAGVLREAFALRRLFRKLEPDVVNAIGLKAVLVSALANAGGRAFLVATVTGLGYLFADESAKRKTLRAAALAGLSLALPLQRHFLIVSNRDDADEFSRRRIVRPGRLRVIPVPGVDTRLFRPAPEPAEGFRIVFPGRMLWDKGAGDFVLAAAAVRERVPDARFVLAGAADPDNPAAIDRKTLDGWAAGGAVSWLGHTDDMPALFGSCHAVCLPSKREGFPRALAEAMACGRAVVTTDVPGCRDIPAGAGILVPAGRPGALAEAIVHLHGNPRERRAMGELGRSWAVESCGIDAITRRVIDCYDEDSGGIRGHVF